MSALQAIERNFLEVLRYPQRAIRRNYKFADMFTEQSDERTVDLAVFTHLPETYRSAAFGVISECAEEDIREAITARRALGAPLFLSISGDRVSVWRVGAEGVQHEQTIGLNALNDLFAYNRERWNPHALHRAKALPPATPRQLDFVDLGLLPAIEREIQDKLHVVLCDVLRELLGEVPDRDQAQVQREKASFTATFRLLAAKILKDREEPAASHWALGDVESVLKGIANYYQLTDSIAIRAFLDRQRLQAAWDRLTNSVNLQNISADTLAFVYENTLVTADNRKLFGTHSTPRQLADYVLGRLDLGRFDLDSLRICEPFTGAGAFLISAVRHLQDLLPTQWSPEERHNFLIPRISGCEVDAFASEVAILSLILADYPNTNGWKTKIQCGDLFQKETLAQIVSGATVILCNPPFEQFNSAEKAKYPEAAGIAATKAHFALKTALDAKPEALGFIMPHGFLRQSQFKKLRGQLSSQYQAIELVSLPEGIFEKADFETALIIATEPRAQISSESTRIKVGSVERKDRKTFLATGQPVSFITTVSPMGDSDLWVKPLDELWKWLSTSPRLGGMADIYRGLQWWKQSDGVSDRPRDGFLPGIYRPRESLRCFKLLPIIRYLSFNPTEIMFPGPACRPWDRPKVFVNTQQVSRGRWRMKAAPDISGLAASQGFFGVWPKNQQISIDALSAVLNSPLANSFIAEKSSERHLTNELLKELPMPTKLDEPELNRAVASYRAALDALDEGLTVDEAELEAKLRRIDELVLDGYGLPQYLRQALFDYFSGHRRPVPHRFSGWNAREATQADLLQAARERALARGRRMKAADLEAAGGGLSLQAVADLLDTPPEQVARLADQDGLLVLPSECGPLFPAIQFSEHKPLAGLPEFLAIFPDPDPWCRLNYLVNPDIRLESKRPVDVLRAGEVDRVITAARLVGEHAAA